MGFRQVSSGMMSRAQHLLSLLIKQNQGGGVNGGIHSPAPSRARVCVCVWIQLATWRPNNGQFLFIQPTNQGDSHALNCMNVAVYFESINKCVCVCVCVCVCARAYKREKWGK